MPAALTKGYSRAGLVSPKAQAEPGNLLARQSSTFRGSGAAAGSPKSKAALYRGKSQKLQRQHSGTTGRPGSGRRAEVVKELSSESNSQGQLSPLSRATQGVEVMRAKLLRAGKKAAATYDLAKSYDSKDFRTKVVSFLKKDPDLRNYEEIEGFLSMVEKYPFFTKYSKAQQIQLASVTTYRVAKLEEVLFKQDDNPDGLYIVISGRCGIMKHAADIKKLVAVAGSGDSVGDLAQLDDRGRRSVTAQVSSERAEFIAFSKGSLDELAVQWRVEEESEKTDFIVSSVPILNNVPMNILENLSPYFEKTHITKDTVLYRQQDEPNGIYFVWEGELQIVKRIDLIKMKGNSNKKDKTGSRTVTGAPEMMADKDLPFAAKKQSKSIQVAYVRKGEYFGEVEVFNDIPRGTAVIALSDCRLLTLSRQSLIEAMPQSVLDAMYRYSMMRLQWRNARVSLILENLANINWASERDPKLSLEPEIKPLSKMKSAFLPVLAQPNETRAWLGAHTIMTDEDAREWGMYYHGPWARHPDKSDRVREERGPNVNSPPTSPSGSTKPGVGRIKPLREGVDEGSSPLSAAAPSGNSGLLAFLEKKKAEILGASYFQQGTGSGDRGQGAKA